MSVFVCAHAYTYGAYVRMYACVGGGERGEGLRLYLDSLRECMGTINCYGLFDI